MKQKIISLILLLGIGFTATAQLNSHPESYKIDQADVEFARALISKQFRGNLFSLTPTRARSGFHRPAWGFLCTGEFTAWPAPSPPGT